MSSFFEYTDNGVRFLGFQDLRSSLVADWKSVFGEGIDLSPTSPDGHHVDLECKTINSVAEGIEMLTSSLNRNQAKGIFLDFLAAMLGIQRAEGESDAALAARMDSSENTGLATYDGMLTYLMNKIGSDIYLTVNEDDQYKDGMPPHTFRVTIPNSNASTDDDIAAAIWHCKPAGIKSSGNHSAYTRDIAGNKQVVNFSRPSDVLFDVRIILSLYNEEEFPVDGTTRVEKSVTDWANGTGAFTTPAFKPGTDIIPSRFFIPIYNVSGISGATISVRLSGESAWSPYPLSISSESTAVLNEVLVSVGA